MGRVAIIVKQYWPLRWNHLKKTLLSIPPNFVTVKRVLGVAPSIRLWEIFSHRKIIMGGKQNSDAEPHARTVLVHPFSPLVTAHTVFCPFSAQSLTDLCTHNTPVSLALNILRWRKYISMAQKAAQKTLQLRLDYNF